jgi:serine/threonine protein kinase
MMDLCRGGELYQYLCHNGVMSEPTAALIFRQVVNGVAALHSHGVAHRDLKPENVLFESFPRVKVTDFGLCGYLAESLIAQSFVGSPCYCSPECLCRVMYDGRSSDVWSLGVILFTMVTGSVPWNITNTSVMIHQILKGVFNIPSEVSQNCARLIRGILKVNPQDRYTIEQILNDPWLAVAERSNFAAEVWNNCEIDEQENVMPVSVLSELSQKERGVKDQGIISPFVDGKRLKGLPQLKIDHMQRPGSANSLFTANVILGKSSIPGRLHAARLLLPERLSSQKTFE